MATSLKSLCMYVKESVAERTLNTGAQNIDLWLSYCAIDDVAVVWLCCRCCCVAVLFKIWCCLKTPSLFLQFSNFSLFLLLFFFSRTQSYRRRCYYPRILTSCRFSHIFFTVNGSSNTGIIGNIISSIITISRSSSSRQQKAVAARAMVGLFEFWVLVSRVHSQSKIYCMECLFIFKSHKK